MFTNHKKSEMCKKSEMYGNFPIDMSPMPLGSGLSLEWGVSVWLELHPLAHNTLGLTYQPRH